MTLSQTLATLQSRVVALVRIEETFSSFYEESIPHWTAIDKILGDQERFPNLQTVEVAKSIWNPDGIGAIPGEGLGRAMLPLVQSRGILSWKPWHCESFLPQSLSRDSQLKISSGPL